MPLLTVIAGPNGSGKSTLTKSLSFEGRENLLDPDAIARRLAPHYAGNPAIAAGREAVTRTREFLEGRVSFAIETTLASKATLEIMRDAKALAFRVDLLYVAVGDAERNIERVRERVRQGGHNVPDDDVRRRYQRSLINIVEAARVADTTMIFDNSGDGMHKVVELNNGKITWRAGQEPEWVAGLLKALSLPAAPPAAG